MKQGFNGLWLALGVAIAAAPGAALAAYPD